jgi:hypothetical protein
MTRRIGAQCNLHATGKENKVLLVANKLDLLPKGAKETRVRAWLKKYVKLR